MAGHIDKAVFAMRFISWRVMPRGLHILGTSWIDGVPFQEVSLEYPHQRDSGRRIGDYLHEVVPALGHDLHEDG